MRASAVVGLCCSLLGCAAANATGFDVDSLLALLAERQVRKVEDALPLLPAEVRANYVLVYASRSLQDASPSAPRAILYSRDAQFVLSFNGDPGQRGYDALETMQFDDRSNTFHFREITFTGPGGSAETSADNPARCTACHGDPARPIWDTPPVWPGVYGSRYRAGLSAPEAAGMRAFLARQPDDQRYQVLIDAPRLEERSTYVENSHSLYNGESFEPPNARFSILLATLNSRSLVASIAGRPQFEAHRYAVLAAATGDCGDVATYFPDALRQSLNASMARYGQSAASADARQQVAKRSRQGRSGGAYDAGMRSTDPITLRYLAEQLLGMPAQRWSLALERDTADLAAPDGALTVQQLLYERLVMAEPELRALRTYRTYSPDDAYCAELRRRSRHILASVYPDGVLPLRAQALSPDGRPASVDLCVGCHNGAVGPALPFADAVALGDRLLQGGYPRGRLLDEILFRLTAQSGPSRMPRGMNLTDGQQHELEAYFTKLAERHRGER